MKKHSLLLSAFFTASLLSTSVAAGPSAVASAPRPRTEAALRCYLGFGPTRCAKNDCNGGWGPVERVDYLGNDAAGADLYEVQYMHQNKAYVVAPDSDGKPGHYLVEGADHYWIKKTVSTRAAQGLIYTRPQNASVVSACPIVEAANDGGGQ